MGSSRMPEFCQKEKRVGLHSAVFRELVLGPKGLGPTLWRKAAGTAKVRLAQASGRNLRLDENRRRNDEVAASWPALSRMDVYLRGRAYNLVSIRNLASSIAGANA